MPASIDLLEERVSSAVGLIARLREKIVVLEQTMDVQPPASSHRNQPPPPPAMTHECNDLAEENARLRAERALVKERIRALVVDIERAIG